MDRVFDIVVLTWKQKGLTKDFVDSFLANTTIPSRLIIIDNNSADGTAEYLLSLKDTPACEFKIIINKENLGFVGGMNQGIGISDAPYVCLANNDLLFSKGWLDEILAVFESDRRIGVLNPNSNNLGEHLNGADIESVARRLRRDSKGVFVEMPFCIGFCMFIRRETLKMAGGLSKEFYPMFFEDTDYSLKAGQAGYLIGVAKGSYVWHKEHASFTAMGDNRKEIFERSRDTFNKKWGRALRIAWIYKDSKMLEAHLASGIALVRKGNYLWFIGPRLTQARAGIFKAAGSYEHSGIRFLSAGSRLKVIWLIMTKKKKYDRVVTDDKLLFGLLARLGYAVMRGQDHGCCIDTIKKNVPG